MNQVYIIYLTVLEDGNVIFSNPFSSYNQAKENIDEFLKNLGNDRSKNVVNVTKDELEALKVNKTPKDAFFVRKKRSEASVYSRSVSIGRIYNSYSIEKYAKLGINEFSLVSNKNEETVSIEKVENLSHGVHVTFISEMKDVLNNRKNIRKVPIVIKEKQKQVSPFILDLVDGKNTLRNITPPPERKIYFCKEREKSAFASQLESGKKTLRHIESPQERNAFVK